MPAQTTITGRIAEPELRFTGSGKAVLELRIAATAREKNKQTGEWGDVGAPLWVGAPFWEQEAERLADLLNKGDQVTVSGVLVLDEYTAKDGTQRTKHVIRSPRFLGYIPQNITGRGAGRANSPQLDQWGTTPASGPQNGSYNSGPQNGTQGDPWATGTQTEAPF